MHGISRFSLCCTIAKTKTEFNILLGEEGDDDHCDNCEDESSQYFSEKAVPRNTKPLQWWQIDKLESKNMSRVTRSILCMPATSIASERISSIAGLTVTNLRSCLNARLTHFFYS